MRSKGVVTSLATLVVVLLWGASTMSAQTVTGTLSGHITDKSGATVPKAKVTAKNEQTGGVREVATNNDGYYVISFLAIGNYEVTAFLPGFRTVEKKGVVVELNKNTVSDFTLEPATLTSTVEVRGGEIPLIDTTTGELKSTLNDAQVAATPLPGRNFISLVEQIPGFQPAAFDGSSNNPTNSTGSYAAFNGQGTRSTTFQIDGVNNDDSSENQNRQGVNISTIKEFQVLTNSFTAEFGRGSGAVVLVQTKSGTNVYHGEAFWQTTNSALNARSYFQNEAGSKTDPATGKLVPVIAKPSSKSHRIGGVFGGPAIKNKLFWIGSYERARSPGEVTSSVSLLPKQFRTPQVDPQLPDAAARTAFIKSIIDRFPDAEPNNTVNNPYGYIANVGRKN